MSAEQNIAEEYIIESDDSAEGTLNFASSSSTKFEKTEAFKKPRTAKCPSFSTGEKRKLINAIMNEPVLWDKTYKEHSNRSAVASAWNRVSSELKKPGKFACVYT